MNAAETYARLGRLMEDAEPVANSGKLVDLQRWAGNIYAVLTESGMGLQAAQIGAATSVLDMAGHGSTYIKVMGVLLQCSAMAEIKAPASAQGSFIPAGNALDAMSSVGKILGLAKSSARIIDPYMDEKTLTDFAILAPETVSIELLADAFTPKPSLPPAVMRWRQQYPNSRSLEARMSAPRALHDRLIILDGSAVYTVTQSFADLAKRSPASISLDHSDMAALKVAAYESLWQAATPI